MIELVFYWTGFSLYLIGGLWLFFWLIGASINYWGSHAKNAWTVLDYQTNKKEFIQWLKNKKK